MLNGYKNYIFGVLLAINGLAMFFYPELSISIGEMDTPQEMIASGVAWILGRNALKKLEG